MFLIEVKTHTCVCAALTKTAHMLQRKHAKSATLWSVKLLAKSLLVICRISCFGACGYAHDINSGKADYESYCTACHGNGGKGDGPRSKELRTKPPDLTLIAQKNGGVFPTDIVYQTIDGTRTHRSHANYEMPVWGRVLLRPFEE